MLSFSLSLFRVHIIQYLRLAAGTLGHNNCYLIVMLHARFKAKCREPHFTPASPRSHSSHSLATRTRPKIHMVYQKCADKIVAAAAAATAAAKTVEQTKPRQKCWCEMFISNRVGLGAKQTTCRRSRIGCQMKLSHHLPAHTNVCQSLLPLAGLLLAVWLMSFWHAKRAQARKHIKCYNGITIASIWAQGHMGVETSAATCKKFRAKNDTFATQPLIRVNYEWAVSGRWGRGRGNMGQMKSYTPGNRNFTKCIYLLPMIK